MAMLTRRSLVAAALASGAAAQFPAAALLSDLSHGMFTHGVASGDPTADAVILWTRFVTSDAGAGTIAWEIAEDETFGVIAASGTAAVRPGSDFCVKVDARGLKPGRPYAYRFVAAQGPSVTGLTRTAPAAGISKLTFALLSCANLPFGHFHAYRDAAARPEIELCIHVGDYIYEYARGKYPSAERAVPGRVIHPETEIVALSDYHRRYASYRDDPDLQELHRLKPWITVWDDHELANNTYDGGAQNHDGATQGLWSARLTRAVQAYLDWMPVRHDPQSGNAIYRRFDWGDLATIIALDTRLVGRTLQLSYVDALGAVRDKDEAAFAAAAEAFAKGALADPKRTLLGAAQEDWLAAEMTRSKQSGAVWQVLAQQLVMGRQMIPEAFVGFLPDDAPDASRATARLLSRAAKYGLPNNLDAWGGYPAARERLLNACAGPGNALVLSGDSHNSWAHNLGGAGGRPQALEIAGTSVTSPGIDQMLPNAPEGGRERAMTDFNAELAWCDITHRGYAMVTLTRDRAEALFVASGSVAEAGAANVGETRLVSEASASGPSPWQRA